MPDQQLTEAEFNAIKQRVMSSAAPGADPEQLRQRLLAELDAATKQKSLAGASFFSKERMQHEANQPANIAENLPGAAAIVGAHFGGPLGAAAAGGLTRAGVELYQGKPPEEALTWGALQGAAEGTLEKITNAVPGAAKAVGNWAGRTTKELVGNALRPRFDIVAKRAGLEGKLPEELMDELSEIAITHDITGHDAVKAGQAKYGGQVDEAFAKAAAEGRTAPLREGIESRIGPMMERIENQMLDRGQAREAAQNMLLEVGRDSPLSDPNMVAPGAARSINDQLSGFLDDLRAQDLASSHAGTPGRAATPEPKFSNPNNIHMELRRVEGQGPGEVIRETRVPSTRHMVEARANPRSAIEQGKADVGANTTQVQEDALTLQRILDAERAAVPPTAGRDPLRAPGAATGPGYLENIVEHADPLKLRKVIKTKSIFDPRAAPGGANQAAQALESGAREAARRGVPEAAEPLHLLGRMNDLEQMVSPAVWQQMKAGQSDLSKLGDYAKGATFGGVATMNPFTAAVAGAAYRQAAQHARKNKLKYAVKLARGQRSLAGAPGRALSKLPAPLQDILRRTGDQVDPQLVANAIRLMLMNPNAPSQ